MNILISNDDGIRAEGIARLAAAALPFGRVYVAAPQSQCSGMSQKLTIRGTLAVEQADFPVPVEAAWAVGGTPADCVKAAVKALVPCRPDVVLTGVNQGWNAGLDIAYSGTIGAALEGVMNGIPAILFRAGVLRPGRNGGVSSPRAAGAAAGASEARDALERQLPGLCCVRLQGHPARPRSGRVQLL